MPTHITQTENANGTRVMLRVSGEMLLEDALLLERIISDLRRETGRRVVVDLADLNFLDSESAAVLRRLENESEITLDGVEIFLQSVVNDIEKRLPD